MISNFVNQAAPYAKQLFSINLKLHLGSVTQVRFRNKAHIKRPAPIKHIKYEAMASSLKMKGYHRSQNPYTPPDNVKQIIEKLESNAKLSSGSNGKPFNLADKFNFLLICSQELKHTVPNSVIHEMNSIDDVIEFYETTVNTFLPLDELATRPLPPNLHIQHNYTRFDPAYFGGHTAFPESSTLVTGIESRKKYKGYDASRYIQP